MSPTLNRRSVIQHFKHSDAIEICDRITFDFYMGLSHIYCIVGISLLHLGLLSQYHEHLHSQNAQHVCTN